MKTWEWIAVAGAWCLILVGWLFKLYLDNRFKKVREDIQVDLDDRIKKLLQQKIHDSTNPAPVLTIK